MILSICAIAVLRASISAFLALSRSWCTVRSFCAMIALSNRDFGCSAIALALRALLIRSARSKIDSLGVRATCHTANTK